MENIIRVSASQTNRVNDPIDLRTTKSHSRRWLGSQGLRRCAKREAQSETGVLVNYLQVKKSIAVNKVFASDALQTPFFGS